MDWPAYTVPGVVPFVALALVAGVVLAGIRAGVNAHSPRATSLGASLIAVLVVGIGGLVAFAGSDDSYFSPPRTYWEFGGTEGRTVVPAAIAVATVATLAVTAELIGASRRHAFRVATSILAGVACLGLVIGFMAIGTGH